MSGFLSKSKQKLEHTAKISLSEFKQLSAVLSTEKNLLASYLRLSQDTAKSALALRDWARSQDGLLVSGSGGHSDDHASGAGVGSDSAQGEFTDTIGRVADILAEDLAASQRHLAEHYLKTYRDNFKLIRSQEENFSALKKERESVQSKIDSLEKKLRKLSSEHKDRASNEQKLEGFRQDRFRLDQKVVDTGAELTINRKRIAREAVLCKLAALRQLGERMTVVDDLGKLIVAELAPDEGHIRSPIEVHDLTREWREEARRCIKGVEGPMFPSFSNTGHFSGGANIIRGDSVRYDTSGALDHSYEYDQEASRLSHDGALGSSAAQNPLHQSQSRSYRSPDLSSHQEHLSAQMYPTNETSSHAYSSYPPPGAAPASIALLGTSAQNNAPSVSYAGSSVGVVGGALEGGNPGSTYETVASQGEPVEEERRASRSYQNDHLLRAQDHSAAIVESEYADAVNSDWKHVHSGSPHQQQYTSTAAATSTPLNASSTPAVALAEEGLHRGSESQNAPLSAGIGGFEHPSHLPLPGASHNTYEPSAEDLDGTGLYGHSPRQPQQPFHSSVTTQVLGVHGVERPSNGDFQALPTSTDPSDVHAPLSATQHETPPVGNDFVGGFAETVPESSVLSAYNMSPVETASPVTASPAGPRTIMAQPTSSLTTEPEQYEDRLIEPALNKTRQASNPSTVSVIKTSKPSPTTRKSSDRQSVPRTRQTSGSLPVTVPSGAPGVTAIKGGKSPPTKQNSYREHRASLSKVEADYHRSSMAYLNQPVVIAPPMRAPPAITTGLPLPSSSPYFNAYAGLGGNSGNSSSSKLVKKVESPREGGVLGSRHGYDLKAGQPAEEKPLRLEPSPNAVPSAAKAKDYSYAIRTDTGDSFAASAGHPSGGKKLNAGAFRRSSGQPGGGYAAAYPPGAPGSRQDSDGAISPAARLRDEWRAASQTSLSAAPASTYATPSATPVNLSESQTMSLPQYTPNTVVTGPALPLMNTDYHRLSTADAPTDVNPAESESNGDLAALSHDSSAVQPLNVRNKRTSAVEMPTSVHTSPQAGVSGFDGGKYVTNLD